MTSTRPRWARILLAATRLAALYAAGVFILAVPILLFLNGPGGNTSDVLEGSPVTAAVGFVAGFLALAVARRLGFAILWSLLFYLWARTAPEFPSGLVSMAFLFWTVLAAPLYLLSAIGLGRGTRGDRVEVGVTVLVWLGTVALALAAPNWNLHGSAAYAPSAEGYLFLVLPFVVAVRELVRVAFAFRRQRPELESITAA